MRRKYVVGGYIVHNNKVLLCMHNTLKRWLPVGGVIEENELPEDALVREVKEETGLDVIVFPQAKMEGCDNYAKPVASPYRIQLDRINDELEYIDFVYFCMANNENFEIQQDELDDLRWFSREDLQHFELSPHVKFLCEEALSFFQETKYRINSRANDYKAE